MKSYIPLLFSLNLLISDGIITLELGKSRTMSETLLTAALQLHRSGGIDKYLTGTPSLSLFGHFEEKQITPYAKHTVNLTFNEKVDFGKLLTLQIPFFGDYLNSIHLYFSLPQLTPPPGSTFLGYTNAIGYAMIEYVEIRIAEHVIDRQPGMFLEIMDYLTTPLDRQLARSKEVGRFDTVNVCEFNALANQPIFVPLQFWFNKKLRYSLPLIDMTNQNIKLHVKLKPFQDVITYDGTIKPVNYSILDSAILCDYYILGDAEKKSILDSQKISTEPNRYLIDQWQTQTIEVNKGMATNRFRLDFAGAIKELVFVVRDVDSEKHNDWINYGRRDGIQPGGEFLTHIGLALDGKLRLDKLPESFYRMVNPSKYHTFGGNRNIYVIPFSELPELVQPAGSINFSKYDNVELLVDFIDNVPQCRIYVLAVGYNILSISSTLGSGLDFMT